MNTYIRLAHVLDETGVTLDIDREGAEYIAAVMRREFERTADGGAMHIADRIERGLR